MDPASPLSDPQRRAVEHGDGPLLVLAGAGSGKTRVITHRVARLIADRGVAPWRILAVTFTNKAAGEMRERVRALLGPPAEQVWLGTFHATCARLIRSNPELAGLRQGFTIYDDDDARSLLGRVLHDLGVDAQTLPLRAVQGRIDRAKQDGLGPDDLPRKRRHADLVALAWTEYDRRLRAANSVDFGDLLVLAVRMLEHSPEFREGLRRRFLHVLVDEFQDTNAIQYRLLKNLANDQRNLCVVGDDDQSIYSWRGAEVRNILEFERDFPGAVTVRLEENYRSTSNVLRSAASVIERNKSRHAKDLWTSNPAGDPVRVALAGDEREEAAAVGGLVAGLRTEGFSLRDAAVFYRINAQSRVLEEALRARNIPYVVVGGFRFYERAEVKDVLAYLRLVVNPADDASFLRVVNAPPRGIGKVTMERLAEHARSAGIPMLAAAARAGSIADLPAAGARGLAALAARFDEWRADAVAGPAAVVERIFDESGYERALQSDRSPEAESRLQNVAELIGSIRDFARESETPTLTAYLEHVTLQSAIDEADTRAERIALMTVHSAKGLEFDTVFVVGLEETVFPYRSWEVPEDMDEEHARLEEERRLCYVAMTRARKRLFLFHALERRLFGAARQNPPSRYLADLPDDCVERAVLPAARRAVADAADTPSFAPRRRRSPAASSPGDAGTPSVAAISAAVAESAGLDFRVGDRVRHIRFGIGRVVEIEPGRLPKVSVEFPNWGRKKIVGTFVEKA